jgi:hypothetical protein
MEKWEYQVVLVDKWGRAMKRDAAAESGIWQFDEKRSSDLVSLLAELGAQGWDLITVVMPQGAPARDEKTLAGVDPHSKGRRAIFTAVVMPCGHHQG